MFYSPIAPARSADAKVSLAELLAAFSFALDLTEGQPAGHSVRACWVAMQVGKAIGLSDSVLHDV